MIELAQLFQDVDAAIVEQEAPVQNIEVKAEETHAHVSQGNQHLDGAITKARAVRKKKWIMFWIFSKLPLLLVVIFPVDLGRESESFPPAEGRSLGCPYDQGFFDSVIPILRARKSPRFHSSSPRFWSFYGSFSGLLMRDSNSCGCRHRRCCRWRLLWNQTEMSGALC